MISSKSFSLSLLADQIDQTFGMTVRARLRLIIDVLIEKKEFVVGPAITLVPQLFSLPLFLSSFIFNCQNLDDSWLRYFLIVFYWISFTPQWTSFFLYISPSSFYLSEWRKSNLGRRITALRLRRPTAPKPTTFNVLSSTRDIVKEQHCPHSLLSMLNEMIRQEK